VLLNIAIELFFFNEAIPVGIIMQRHSFIDIGILFYGVTDLTRGINIPFLPF